MKRSLILSGILLLISAVIHSMEPESNRSSGPKKELTPELKNRLDETIGRATINAEKLFALLTSPDFAGYNVSNYIKNGDSLIMWAALGNHINLATLLLKTYNVDPNKTNAIGETALMLACYSGYIDMIRLLLRYGARLDLQDQNGDTCFSYARHGNHYEAVINALTTTPPTTNIQNY